MFFREKSCYSSCTSRSPQASSCVRGPRTQTTPSSSARPICAPQAAELLRQGIEHLVAQAAAVGLRHALEQPGIGHSALQARREQRLSVADGADDIGLLRLPEAAAAARYAAVRPIAPRERAQSGSR